MKVAVTARGPSLDAALDPRFGRCPYFILIETEDTSFEVVENPSVSLGGGAGIQSAQLMSEKGVRFVLTGNCGPNAYQTLSTAGIGVIVECSGTVADVVERFKAEQLNVTSQPNVASHFGMGDASSTAAAQPVFSQQPPITAGGTNAGDGGGRGMGRGMGQGMGQGMGRGMGRGTGRGMGQGIGQGMGRGMGRGMGQGMGQGMGRGMGRGMGQGRGDAPGVGGGRGRGMGAPMGPGAVPGAFGQGQPSLDPVTPRPSSPGQEVEMLRAQAEAMAAELQAINTHIAEMERGTDAAPIAVVDAEICSSCGQCEEVCPVGAISVYDVARVDKEKCTGCGSCVDACPNAAISMLK